MNKIKQLLVNMYYVISSNLLTLIVSVATTLFLPVVLGIENYGYYQLYLFYIPYVSFLHLGWPDGIYLQFGGEEYSQLDKKYFKGQFYSFLFFQSILSIIFLLLVYINNQLVLDNKLIFVAVILNILLLNIRAFLLFILQMTNRMREYSSIVIIDRLIFALGLGLLLLYKENNFLYYILVDLLAKAISLVLVILKCKDFIFKSGILININVKEAIKNIQIGINVMLAYIAGLFIVGIVRFGIQNHWGIETFGKISLTLSVSNILMVFISAVSVALFPLLKRTNSLNYNKTYLQIKSILMPLILGSMLLYFPLSYILYNWLPAYADSIKYMAVVFPIIVFEGKVNLLTNTYLKVLRKEKIIFIVNVVSALLSFLVAGLTIYVFDNLLLTILSIVFLLAFRSIYSEIMLSKYLEIFPLKDIFIEIFLVIIFIIVGWNLSKLLGATVYLLLFIGYLYYQRESLIDVVELLKKQLIKK